MSKSSGSFPSLIGVNSVMFLTFVGFSSTQFHSYLFADHGFRDLEIGILLAAGYGAAILSPLLQVAFIRVFRGPRLPLMAALALAGLALLWLPHARNYYGLMALFFLFCFAAAAITPLNTACTLEITRDRGRSLFFWIRSLGTIGFLLGCVVSLRFSHAADLPALYAGFGAALLLALALAAGFYSHTAPEQAPEDILVNPHPKAAPSFGRALALLAEPRTRRLLLVIGVMSFANSMATCVQANYLVERWQGGQRSISAAWVVSTAVEAPLMLLCGLLLRRKGLGPVLGLGLAGTAVKVLGQAWAAAPWQYFLALTMHGFFFSGALTGFGIYLDGRHRREDRPALQALSSVFLLGLPSALAGLAAGAAWHWISLRAVYLLAGGVAALAAAMGLCFLFIFPLPQNSPTEAVE